MQTKTPADADHQSYAVANVVAGNPVATRQRAMFQDKRPEFLQLKHRIGAINQSGTTNNVVLQREIATKDTLKTWAATAIDVPTFFTVAGQENLQHHGEQTLADIWQRYGPDDAVQSGEEVTSQINFDHSLSDGNEGAAVEQELPGQAVADGDKSLSSLIDEGLIQAKSYGPQSKNTYNRNGQTYTVTYDRTGGGSIDFDNWNNVVAHGTDNWTNPVTAHQQDILFRYNGQDYIDYVRAGKYLYPWIGNEKNRSIHFRAANVKENVPGSGQPSDGVTWHHQETPRGQMVGVETEVHKRHGHNGGVALW